MQGRAELRASNGCWGQGRRQGPWLAQSEMLLEGGSDEALGWGGGEQLLAGWQGKVHCSVKMGFPAGMLSWCASSHAGGIVLLVPWRRPSAAALLQNFS